MKNEINAVLENMTAATPEPEDYTCLLYTSGDARSGGPGGTAPAVTGTGKHPGCAARGGTGRQVGPKIPISKDRIFLSRNVEIVVP